MSEPLELNLKEKKQDWYVAFIEVLGFSELVSKINI